MVSFLELEKNFNKDVFSTQFGKTELCEMTHAELQGLVYMIRQVAPAKMVECGVAAGGTTAIILDELPVSSTLYSIDFSKQYYRDKTKETGYIALEKEKQKEKEYTDESRILTDFILYRRIVRHAADRTGSDRRLSLEKDIAFQYPFDCIKYIAGTL